MKKILLLLFILGLCIPAGIAQEKQKKEKQKKDLPSPIVEVWGGMGMSSVAGTLSKAEKRLTGLFGAGFTLPLTRQNNIHFEGAYTFQGFKYKPQIYAVDDTTAIALELAEQRFNYFKLTVQDRYFFDRKRTYYVNGGLYLGYLSNSRFQANYEIIDTGTGLAEHREIDDDNSEIFHTFDLGLTGGIGVRLGNKALSNFTVEARFSYGLLNVAKPREGEKPKARNFYGVLKLGVDIPVRD